MLFDANLHPRERIAQATWFAGWVVVTALCLWLRPDAHLHGTHQQLGLPPCPSVLVLNRPCPACGMTTSWSALVHGNLPMAFAAHPLGPVMYAFYTAWAGLAGWGAWRGRRLTTERPWFNRWVAVVGVVFIVFGIGRAVVTPAFQTPNEARWTTR